MARATVEHNSRKRGSKERGIPLADQDKETRRPEAGPPTLEDWKLVQSVRNFVAGPGIMPLADRAKANVAVGEEEYVRANLQMDIWDEAQCHQGYRRRVEALERVNAAVEDIFQARGWTKSETNFRSGADLQQIVGAGESKGETVIVIRMSDRQGKPISFYTFGDWSDYAELCDEIKRRFQWESDSKVFFSRQVFEWLQERWILKGGSSLPH